MNRFFRKFADLCLSPWTSLAGLGGGLAFGLLAPDMAAYLARPGKLYLGLLQMCVMPIIVTAIAGSLARLTLFGQTGAVRVSRLALVFGCGLLLAALGGLLIGLIANPGGDLDPLQRKFLAERILDSEAADGGLDVGSLWLLAEKIVPSNVIRSAASGDTLAVLVFSMLLGLGLGRLEKTQGVQTVELFDAFYNALLKIMGWVLIFLPPGLFALMAGQVGEGHIVTALVKMGALVITIYATAAMAFLLFLGLVSWRCRLSPWRALAGLREPLMTAFGTSSSLAALPAALRVSESAMGVRRQTAQLVLPIGFSLHPLGNVLHVVIACLFILQIYGLSAGPVTSVILVLGGILVACSMSGAPGIASMSLLAALLAPLGVPVEVALVLLVALDPIIDPVLTMLNVFGNLTAVTLIEEGRSGQES